MLIFSCRIVSCLICAWLGAGILLLSPKDVFASCSYGQSADLPEYRVSSVVDGDSLQVAGLGSVRLLGVNAPEMQRDRKVKLSKPEPFGQQATQFVKRLAGQTVRLGIQGEDRYRRKLAHVWFKESGVWHSLEAELLKQGLAFQVFESPDDELTECLRDSEFAARTKQRGVWSELDYWKNAQRGGFVIWQGRAERVSKGKKHTWVRLSEDRVVRLQNQWLVQKKYHFNEKEYEYRGWAIDRKNTKYERFALKLRQTTAIQVY